MSAAIALAPKTSVVTASMSTARPDPAPRLLGRQVVGQRLAEAADAVGLAVDLDPEPFEQRRIGEQPGAQEQRVGLEVAERRGERLEVRRRRSALRPGGGPLEPLDEASVAADERRQDERRLVREVVVEDAVGHARPPCDLARRQLPDRSVVEEGVGGGDEVIAEGRGVGLVADRGRASWRHAR